VSYRKYERNSGGFIDPDTLTIWGGSMFWLKRSGHEKWPGANARARAGPPKAETPRAK